mgnify:CR=1 FL=1
MSRYDAVVKMWQDWNVHTVDDLALRLDNFRILFAYNSGKLENAEINYHDTREIFENGKVVGYTGKIEWDTSKPNGTPRKLLDVSKATNLGWTYKTELEDGLRLSYEDFLNNPMRAER